MIIILEEKIKKEHQYRDEHSLQKDDSSDEKGVWHGFWISITNGTQF